MKTVENLAFKGGGVLGAAYAGVYQALQEVKLLGSDRTVPLSEIANPLSVTVYGNVQRVAGTSAGAIFATMVALGLTFEETEAVLKSVNFQDFVDFDENFAEDGGFLKGEKFLKWMTEFVYKYFGAFIGKDDPTFGDLAAAISDWQSWLESERRASGHTALAYGRDLAAGQVPRLSTAVRQGRRQVSLRDTRRSESA